MEERPPQSRVTRVNSALETAILQFYFDEFVLDPDRRELRGPAGLSSLEPQVFDLLAYLIRNRDRVVSKDDIMAAVWDGRIVSESALTTRINAARHAIGDSGEAQRLIKTLPRKPALRRHGAGREESETASAAASRRAARPHSRCRTVLRSRCFRSPT